MFSWKITLVPLRKFFPMMNTSSPPLTEQLWRLFFRISGSPAGWAGEADHSHAACGGKRRRRGSASYSLHRRGEEGT